MHLHTHAERELSPLTDSLSSLIRWRYGDYEAMLRAEVHLMLSGRDEDVRRLLPVRSHGDGEEA